MSSDPLKEINEILKKIYESFKHMILFANSQPDLDLDSSHLEAFLINISRIVSNYYFSDYQESVKSFFDGLTKELGVRFDLQMFFGLLKLKMRRHEHLREIEKYLDLFDSTILVDPTSASIRKAIQPFILSRSLEKPILSSRSLEESTPSSGSLEE